MADMTLLQGAITGLKTASEIAQALVGMKVSAEVNAKAIELQSIVMAAQSSAIAAQSQQFTMLEEIRALKEQVARAKAWEEEQQRYHLKKLPSGALAYFLKGERANGEPPHSICTTCYNKGQKTVMQESHTSDY